MESESIEIYARLINGRTFSIKVEKNELIESVKKKIMKFRDGRSNSFLLLFQAQELDNESSVSANNITEFSTLHVIEHLGGGFTMPDIEVQHTGKFDMSAPNFREVTNGLNFDVLCKKCHNLVIVQIGFNTKSYDFFELSSLVKNQICKNCGAILEEKNFRNIYFVKCIWKFEYLEQGNYKLKDGIGICPENEDFIMLDTSDEHQKEYLYMYLRVVKIQNNFNYSASKEEILAKIEEQKKAVGQFIFPKIKS